MSGAQLRELAGLLPQAKGPAAVLPTLPNYLPRQQLVPGAARYLIGAGGLLRLNINLSPELIDFSMSPEVLWARVERRRPRLGRDSAGCLSHASHRRIGQAAPGFEQLAPRVQRRHDARRNTQRPIIALVVAGGHRARRCRQDSSPASTMT